MRVYLTIEGFKTKFGFETSFFRGDIDNGEQLRQYLQKYYRFSRKQELALDRNRFTIHQITPPTT